MKPAYVIAPLLLFTGFLAIYPWSSSKKKEKALAEKENYYGGKSFVGRDGKKEAEADISRGAPKLFIYGKTRGDIVERTAILKQRFELEIDTLAGCVVSEALVAFSNDYNAVVRNHIMTKYGVTAFEEADREAMRIWEAKKPKENQVTTRER